MIPSWGEPRPHSKSHAKSYLNRLPHPQSLLDDQEWTGVALYRLYDEGNALLYVGITGSPFVRFCGHRRLAPWWPQVVCSRLEWYGTRHEAREAEKAAIAREKPVYNIKDRP